MYCPKIRNLSFLRFSQVVSRMWPQSLTQDSRDTAVVVAETFHNPKQYRKSETNLFVYNYAVMFLPNLWASAKN